MQQVRHLKIKKGAFACGQSYNKVRGFRNPYRVTCKKCKKSDSYWRMKEYDRYKGERKCL